ncbi:MAG TPA: pilus assembly PilX N-terminal domain-containing protein [Tepidisphaeraceae bacterium]|nr:pilus assembly PilX N-terminal domain-containing protein [Tepidisphaeraceae bacterium]
MQRMRKRRGVAAVLAMLYLVLFGILALGFYSTTTTSVQVVHNDSNVTQASLAAESGLQFVTYQLSQVRITPGIAESGVFANLATQLGDNLNSTLNMGGRAVGFNGSTISIPASTGSYINLPDSDGAFRATITQDGAQVVVKVTGRSSKGSISRAIQLKYDRDSRDGLFDFAVASKGKITTSGSSNVVGSPDERTANFLSAATNEVYPIVISGKKIGGDVSIVSRTADVDYQKGSVGGSTSEADIRKNHIKKGVPEPEFPTIDIDLYRKYAVNEWPASVARTRSAPNDRLAEASYAWANAARSALRQGRSSGRVLLAGGSLADVLAVRAGEAWCEYALRDYSRLLIGHIDRDALDLLPAHLASQTLTGLSPRGGLVVLAKADKGGGGNTGGGGTSGGENGNNGGGNGHVYRNCYIPTGSGSVKFTGKDVVEGVLYVEPGNSLTFAGGVQIRGIIVVGKDPNWDYSKSEPPPVTTLLDFQGTVDGYGVETLDPEIFGDLVKQKGLFIAGLGAAVSFKGNFNTTITGSIIASSVTFQGSAGGSICGSIIGMDPNYPMDLSNAQSSPLVFVARAKENPPSGVHFSGYFKPDPKTYAEVSTAP